MTLSRNQIVAETFAAHVGEYERSARLQAQSAEKLAGHLPELDDAKILEIGCGTGFLTQHLLERYPDADFLITDLAPEMVAE